MNGWDVLKFALEAYWDFMQKKPGHGVVLTLGFWLLVYWAIPNITLQWRHGYGGSSRNANRANPPPPPAELPEVPSLPSEPRVQPETTATPNRIERLNEDL